MQAVISAAPSAVVIAARVVTAFIQFYIEI